MNDCKPLMTGHYGAFHFCTMSLFRVHGRGRGAGGGGWGGVCACLPVDYCTPCVPCVYPPQPPRHYNPSTSK
jgi:hypothetical protein